MKVGIAGLYIEALTKGGPFPARPNAQEVAIFPRRKPPRVVADAASEFADRFMIA